MNRPDTGTQRNMIVEMAAAIVASKADYCARVAEQYREKSNASMAAHWQSKADAMLQALAVLDANAGCWS